MSSGRGNVQRTRAQRYQNTTAFKNDLHDKSIQTKRINSLQIAEVCEKCKKIIEWKIKYKKFKPLKAPKTCVKCSQRNIKHAYHTLCSGCASEKGVCPKCGLNEEIVPREKTLQETLQLDKEMQEMLKSLPERKRRTFLRYVEKKRNKKRKRKLNKEDTTEGSSLEEKAADGAGINNETDCERTNYLTKDDLLAKLTALKLSCKNDNESDDEWGSEFDDSNLEDGDSSNCDTDND